MKYAIYGIGVIGKRLYSFLGEDKVCCFIDGDESKVGGEWDGKKIVSLSEYKEAYNSALIIISSLMGTKTIENKLLENEIFEYLCLYGSIDSFYDYEYAELKKIYKETKNNNGDNRLYGDDVLTVILSLEDNESTKLLVKDSLLNQCMLKLLKNNNIEVITCEKTVSSLKDSFDESIVKNKRYPIFGINEMIERYKNQNICAIVCTGPSLNYDDLEYLKINNIPSISMNGIYSCFDKVKWRPDIYITSDANYIEKRKHDLKNIKVSYKLISDTTDIKIDETWKRFHIMFPHNEMFFSEDIELGLCSSMNVTYLSIQVAAILGFKNIVLTGLDYTFGDRNNTDEHFDKDYLNGLRRPLYNADEKKYWHTRGYKKALSYSQENNINIFNATRGGELEIFERRALKDIIDEFN